MKHKDCPPLGIARIVLLALIFTTYSSHGQTKDISFQDLSAFEQPGKSWKVVEEVVADLEKPNTFETEKGTGVLVNQPEKGNGKDLVTKAQYGDFDIELDYMMAKDANSGVYFIGQYELQLNDSWGSTPAASGENGGIYERWDDSKPEGQKGYQGVAPRQNVSKAPGLWQHLEASFQAPRFDANGNKIENAKFIYVRLNGVTIHEDVELFGPTRGSMFSKEKATGPLRLQGDHGAVAFKNLKITSFDKPRPELTNLEYKIFAGKYDQKADYNSLPPESEGKSVILTSELRTESDQFVMLYTGDLLVKEAGEYNFNLDVDGGSGYVRINGDEIIPLSNRNGRGSVDLPAGEVPFELVYTKVQDWVDPGLGLSISGAGIREYLISEESMDFDDPVDPILVEATTPVVFRSFMDIPVEGEGGKRLTHTASVGSPKGLHYTYDLKSGTIVQLWRGGFLDATPMWYSRGNGSSRPLGSVLHLGQPQINIAKLDSKKAAWPSDTTGINFRPLGYSLDANDLPSFTYSVSGVEITDTPRVSSDAQGLQRTISAAGPVKDLYVRLASGQNIEEISKDLYLVGDKAYYIQLNDLGKEKPILREKDGKTELLVPLQTKLTYTLLF